jgi:hypothetical protein
MRILGELDLGFFRGRHGVKQGGCEHEDDATSFGREHHGIVRSVKLIGIEIMRESEEENRSSNRGLVRFSRSYILR